MKKGIDGHLWLRYKGQKGGSVMKHVIAGETKEDTIEWRLVMDIGEPTLQARKAGGVWRTIAWADTRSPRFWVNRSSLEGLGFNEFFFD
jgi:hypothetical protein